MIAAASSGALTLDKLEAMTCVCSVGLDMIAVPGDTSAETIAAIIADEAAIGMVNTKTTAVRIIPAPGCKVGDTVEFGGLLGSAPVQAVHPYSSAGLHRPRRAYPRAAAQPENLTSPPPKKRTGAFFPVFTFMYQRAKVLQMAQALERGVERFILLGKMQTDDVVHVLVEE